MLDPGLAAALDELARRRPLLLASDYDGVLARLRDDPSAAVLEPGVGELLGRLAAVEGVTVALVSGRGVEDLRRTSGLTGPFRWVGSHGAEFDGPLSGELAGRRDALAAALAPLVDAARTWGDVPALAVVACAGAYPEACVGAESGAASAQSARAVRESPAQRWGARLAEVARAVTEGRPLLVRVGEN